MPCWIWALILPRLLRLFETCFKHCCWQKLPQLYCVLRLLLVGSLALYTPERPSFTFTQRVARQKMLEGPCRIILSCAISGTVGGKATTQISWHGKFCVLPELYSLVIDLIHLQDKSAPKLSDEQVVECPFLGNLEIERPVDTSCVHIVTE